MGVLVVDDHPIVLDGAVALSSRSWITIMGYARSGREAVTAAGLLRPDVVLLDLRLPDMLALEGRSSSRTPSVPTASTPSVG